MKNFGLGFFLLSFLYIVITVGYQLAVGQSKQQMQKNGSLMNSIKGS